MYLQLLNLQFLIQITWINNRVRFYDPLFNVYSFSQLCHVKRGYLFLNFQLYGMLLALTKKNPIQQPFH